MDSMGGGGGLLSQSYFCICGVMYDRCEDIPHCAEELDDCDVEQEATCKDSTVAPFYTCQCTPGYMDNPVTLQQGGMPGRDCIGGLNSNFK